MLDYDFEEIYDFIIEWFFQLIYGIRDMLFGLGNFGSIREYCLFFFVTVPVIFASFEAIFDWILPTFFNLEPMGVRRFFIPRSEVLRVPELKQYRPITNSNFRYVRVGFFKSRFNRVNFDKLDPIEFKKYQQLYQQKFNVTATPMELKRFIIMDKKNYNYLSGDTGLSQNRLVGFSYSFRDWLSDSISNMKSLYKDLKNRHSSNDDGIKRTQSVAEGKTFDNKPSIHSD